MTARGGIFPSFQAVFFSPPRRPPPSSPDMSGVCAACSAPIARRNEISLCGGPCGKLVHRKCTAKTPGGTVCVKCRGRAAVKPTVAVLFERINLLSDLVLRLSQEVESAHEKITELSARPPVAAPEVSPPPPPPKIVMKSKRVQTVVSTTRGDQRSKPNVPLDPQSSLPSNPSTSLDPSNPPSSSNLSSSSKSSSSSPTIPKPIRGGW